MKRIIFLIIITITIYGCQQLPRKSYCERKADKFARLIKDCPQLIDTTTLVDTIRIRDTVAISIPSKVDSVEFDSLLSAYCDEARLQLQGKADTVRLYELKYKLRNRYGEGETMLFLKGDTVVVGWNENKNGLNLSIISVKKQIEKTKSLVVPCPQLKWYNDPFIVSIANAVFWLFLIWLFRRKS